MYKGSFNHCRFCSGRGCTACSSEKKRYERKRTKAIIEWKPPTKDDIKTVLNGLEDGMSEEELEARLSTPKPLMTISINDPKQMSDAKELIGGSALKKMAEGGHKGFMEKFLKAAEEYRIRRY